ncbi:MAG: NAD(+) synthase [Omnitrophica bacterium]|nr:NAD(+) synthase [Candidatus Omnitrophota bacterium]
MTLSKELAAWIGGQVKSAGKKGIVLGLSGGVDSAVVAALSKLALNDRVLGLILPCRGHAEDVRLAQEVAKAFDINTREVVLDSLFDELTGAFPEANKLARANVKPRLRMAMLYYFANTLDYLVAGTGNKSELTVGYFTKYGDGGVDILPLGNLLKKDVKKLAAELGVPREVINRAPSAGLWEGQTDEGEMGITYDELDRAIIDIEAGKTENIDNKILAKVKTLMQNSEHKKCKVPLYEPGKSMTE